jgi:aryl sulfotransferase
MSNLDMDAFMAARAAAVGLEDMADFGPPPAPPTGDPAERFWTWVYDDTGTAMGPTLAAILHHLATFWPLRDHDNVALFHYSDLLADLPGQLQALSEALHIPTTDARLQQYATNATFDHMKARADDLVPDAGNRIWRNNRDFFHRGRNGQWVDLLNDEDQHRYHQRVADLVPADLATWAHTGWAGAYNSTPQMPLNATTTA